MRAHSILKVSLFLGIFVCFGLAASQPADAARRTGDKSTLRVPAARTQLVQDLLQHTAEADAAAAAEAERLAQARALVAAAEREAALRAALRPAAQPAPVAAPAPQPAPVIAAPTPAAPATVTPSPEPAQPIVAPAAAPAPKPAVKPADKKTPSPEKADETTAFGGKTGPSLGDFGDGTKLALGVLVLFVGVWFIRRKKNNNKSEPQVPSHLRFLGKMPLGRNWQISLLELPGEILVLGTGENGVQVLARIDDEEHIAELREAQEKGGKGLGKHLKGLMGMLRTPSTPDSGAAIADTRPRLADPTPEMASPAELVEMQRALDMHRAFAGRSFGAEVESQLTSEETNTPPEPPSEELELETMRQRLADLRAGRFAQ